jgi:hypothetical protein
MHFNAPVESLMLLLDHLHDRDYPSSSSATLTFKESYEAAFEGAVHGNWADHMIPLTRTLLYHREGYRHVDPDRQLRGEDYMYERRRRFFHEDKDNIFWNAERNAEIKRGAWFCRNRVFVDAIMAMMCAALPSMGENGSVPPVRSLVIKDGDHACARRVFDFLARSWEETFSEEMAVQVAMWKEDWRLWKMDEEHREAQWTRAHGKEGFY